MRKSSIILLFICIMIFSVSCTINSLNEKGEYYPTNGWKYAEEKDSFINKEMINEMYEHINSNNLEYHTLTIIKNGFIVEEKYFPHNNKPVDREEFYALFSATKSINSGLMGIVISKGLIKDEYENIISFFPEYEINNMSEEKQNINIQNILTMSCGLDWNEYQYSYADPKNIYNKWVNNKDRVKFVLDLPTKNKSGEKFNYNTGASHLIPAIIQKATGKTTLEFAQENLFSPLGIMSEDIYWPTDSKGINKGGGLNMKPHDIAKIGYLYLKNGKWEGKQIIPEEWINKSFNKAFSVGYGRGFGYHWWLYDCKDIKIYAAEGYKEQRLYIVPELDLIVVLTGNILDSKDNSLIVLKKFIIPAVQNQVD